MKKLFVSVPMKGRTEEEIKASIQKMKKIAEICEGEELELIDSYIEDNPPKDRKEAVWYLGESLKKLAQADVFVGIAEDYDWSGCCIERQTAEKYGLKVETRIANSLNRIISLALVLNNYVSFIAAVRTGYWYGRIYILIKYRYLNTSKCEPI